MRLTMTFAAALSGILLLTSAAQAACEGSNGRGWGSGKGNGAFEMTTADKSCQITFPGFIDDATNKRTPATEMKLTRAPKNGKITVNSEGPIYTPNPGFTGKDKFCTSNTAPGMKGKLSGCVTVTVK